MPTYLDDFENLRHPLAHKYPLAITTPHMIGWLHSRTNNPLLKERFPVEVFIHSADAAERGIQDGDAVVLELAEASSARLHRLDLRVEAFSHRVRDGVRTVREKAWQVRLQHLRHLDDRSEP